MNTLPEMLRDSVERWPDNVLVHHLDQDWTYRVISERAASVAAWLRQHGLKDGQRVALLLPNSADYVVAYLAVLLARGVVVALNPETTPRELSYTLVHGEPTAVITAPQCERDLDAISPQLASVRMVLRTADDPMTTLSLGRHTALFSEAVNHEPIQWPQEGDPSNAAQIIYTSGTTGNPKGVVLSHRNLLANCQSIVEYLTLSSSDSVLVVLPFFYSYGNSVMLTHIATGGRLVLVRDTVFWNKALDLMDQRKVTGLSGVPATYAMLLNRSTFAERPFPDLRYLTCAGGALTPALITRLRQAVPHADLFLMYGQTEATARLSRLPPEDLDAKAGSIGKGIPGVTLSVLDEKGNPLAPSEVGEIVAQGPNVMQGYWKDPRETQRVLRPEGLRTGDMASMDEDGYIYIVGRRSDMIKSNSYRISPSEIENVLLELESIREAAVVGQSDELQGEILIAFIVPAVPGRPPSKQAVLRHCSGSLPRHKLVRHVYAVDSLPKTASHKVKRQELQKWLEATRAEPTESGNEDICFDACLLA